MTDRDSGRPPRAPWRTDPVAGFADGPEPPDGTGEEGLRLLLREAVDGIAREPAADTLDQLRQAVVTRRRRRRQLLFGAAASVALLGIGAPLVLSAAGGVGGPGPRDTARGTDQGAVVEGTHEQGGEPGGPGPYPSDGLSSSPAEPRPGDPGTGAPEDGGGGQEADGDGAWDLGIASPTCDRGQLGRVTTVTGEPDAEGRVYGSIRMVNVSSDACRVTGNGELSALPLGRGIATARVQVLDRTEGDRAPGLPPPDETLEELVLPPGEAYEVRFAWVPSTGARSCEVAAEPTDGGGLSTDLGGGSEPGATPTGDPVGTDPDGTGQPATGGGTGEPTTGGGTGDPATGGGTGDTGGTEPTTPTTGGTGDSDGGGTSGPGGTQPPVDGGDGGSEPATGGTGGGDASDGVLLRYTPAAGGPEAARIRLEGSCSGTIYRTGVLEAPAV